MSVTYTTPVYFQLPSQEPPLELQDVMPIAYFLAAGKATGDGTGGTVTHNIHLKKANDNKPIYVVLSSLLLYTDDATGGLFSFFSPVSTDWEEMKVPFLSTGIGLWQGDFSGRSYNMVLEKDTMRPKYLGKAVPSETAELQCLFSVNTNAKLYNLFLRGRIYGQPIRLPF